MTAVRDSYILGLLRRMLLWLWGQFQDCLLLRFLKRQRSGGLRKTLEDSALNRLYLRLTPWFSRQWQRSRVVQWCCSQRDLTGTFSPVRGLLSRWQAWCAARALPRRLETSLFVRPELFAAAAVVLLPLLPTMGVLALVCGGFFSLVLALGTGRLAPSDARAPLSACVCLFALVYLYATLTSATLRGSLLPGLLTAAFVLFYLVLTGCRLDGDRLFRLVAAMVAVGVLVALYGFYQKLFPARFRSVWTDTDMFSVTFRVYSTLENPNVLGEYFLLVLPLGAAAMLGARGPEKKLLYGAACCLMGVCLVLTYSRGCYLGILFAAAVFLVLLDRRFLVLGLLALALSPFYLPQSVLDRFTSIGNMGDTSTSYRVYIWLGTLDMLKQYWFSGIGPGTSAFNIVYPEFAYNAITAPHSHNLFLQLVCDTGICGLIVFLVTVVVFFRTVFTAMKTETDRRRRYLQIGCAASVAGFLVESMTDYTFYNYRVLLLFWVVLALGKLACAAPRPNGLAAGERL